MTQPPHSSLAWYQRLRFRLIGIQLVVVIVGVLVVLAAMRFFVFQQVQAAVNPILENTLDASTFAAVTEVLRTELQIGVFISLLLAAIGSFVAGGVASYLLWQTLVRPLRNLAASSHRIANGNYADRVPFPEQSGEAMRQLATNFNQMAGALANVEQQRIDTMGNVAHELRTPLSGLQGMIEGLEDGVFAPDQETFDMMGREVKRMSRLVEDLQNLSRVEAGATEFVFTEFVLCNVVERVVAALQPNADDHGLRLDVQLASPPLTVFADADRTAQILTNLIDNGIRYTPRSGVISVSLRAVDGAAQVAVQDTGIGLSEKDLKYIFERFYRVDRSRSRKSGGNGIGLTIALHLAQGMGGNLDAFSRGEGRGSTFILELPLA